MKYGGKTRAPYTSGIQAVPFENAEEAWFWFISAQAARNEGARFVSGLGLVPRPCEPVDILKVLDRLHRQRRLQMDHLLVLRHYGRRSLAPDPRRAKEARAHRLWMEALERLEGPLQKKGIVRERSWIAEYMPKEEEAQSPVQAEMPFQCGLYADAAQAGEAVPE